MGKARRTFAVPAGAGTYAPEVVYLSVDPTSPKAKVDIVTQITTAIEALPAGATLEIDLLKPGGNPENGADWIVAAYTRNAVGAAALLELAGWQGVRIRAKSGGTAGNLTVSLAWR